MSVYHSSKCRRKVGTFADFFSYAETSVILVTDWNVAFRARDKCEVDISKHTTADDFHRSPAINVYVRV